MKKHAVIFILSGTLLALTACQKEPVEPSITGYIEAEMRLIASPQSGWIRNHTIEAGDLITKGQLLFQLDTETQLAQLEEAEQNMMAAEAQLQDLQKGARPAELNSIKSQLQEAQAKLNLANKELQRIQSLLDKGLSTAEQLDQAQAQRKISQAQVNTLKSNIEVAGLGGRIDAMIKAEAQIRAAHAQFTARQYVLQQRSVNAEFDGEVKQVMYHQGEYINVGAAVLSVRMLGQDKVRFHLPQDKLMTVKLGQTIQVIADGMEQSMPAKISYIASTAEFTPPVIYSKDSREKLVFLIEARLNQNHSMHPGLPVDILL